MRGISESRSLVCHSQNVSSRLTPRKCTRHNTLPTEQGKERSKMLKEYLKLRAKLDGTTKSRMEKKKEKGGGKAKKGKKGAPSESPPPAPAPALTLQEHEQRQALTQKQHGTTNKGKVSLPEEKKKSNVEKKESGSLLVYGRLFLWLHPPTPRV